MNGLHLLDCGFGVCCFISLSEFYSDELIQSNGGGWNTDLLLL